MFWLQKLEDALRYNETVYITDGTYTTKVIDYESAPYEIHLKTENGKILTLDSADFFRGICLVWSETDKAWYIAPDWWGNIGSTL
ncbi:MAG: hypothetical protein J6S14_15615 [Clostridia bacterium]|nr:hypothetical protein [Clostridia bacterium]